MKEQDRKTHKKIWDPEEMELSVPGMLRRIETTIRARAWNHAAAVLAHGGVRVNELRVAEVGCGTGTASLTFGLLGASITLIDLNQKVLESARKTYDKFGCGARFVRADCLKPVPDGLEGTFDVVLSGGLAEHFTGTYRQKCLDYHRSLLKPGGMAVIGVPNRLSPFYQWVRCFRILTGTWGPDVEVPFSNAELRSLAGRSGFRNYYVLGACSLVKDLKVYSRGFVSAVVDLCPKNFKDPLRKWKAGIEDKASYPSDPKAYAAKRCREAFESAENGTSCDSSSILSDWMSSGLNLMGFR
jgi:SAM-dependent methyltransferase